MNYYPFGLSDFQRELEGSGRRVKRAGKGLLTNCLVHLDHDPSAEVFEDGWMVCYSCGQRYHISNYFPNLKDPNWNASLTREKFNYNAMPKPVEVPLTPQEKTAMYTQYDLMEDWLKLPPIPRDHKFKNIPLSVLDELGWRLVDNFYGMGSGYLIPYFNHTKTKIPFAQVRHLSGERRFTMLPNAEVTAYGKWNIVPGEPIYIVEGCSDCAALDYCNIPWLGMPSASSSSILVNFAKYALKNDITIVYGGDNDVAGDKLRDAIDNVAPYRLKQPPKKYKDWCEFLDAEGMNEVSTYCMSELNLAVDNTLFEIANEVFA